MPFNLSRDFLSELQSSLETGNELKVIELTHHLHPADIARIIGELDHDKVVRLIQYLDSEKAADSIMEMEEDAREDLLSTFSSEQIAKYFIDNLDSDDAADVIGELPEKVKDEVISQLDNVEQASDIVDLLNYDENTAGGLMAKELIRVNEKWTLTRCIKEMRKQAEGIDNIYTIYVIDDDNKLKGLLSLKKMLLAPARSSIESLYNREIISVKTSMHRSEVAEIMSRYDLVVLPVLDELGRLVGRITIDDVVDVITEEAEKDYQMASGLSEAVDIDDNFLQISRARLPWLLIGLLGGIVTARLIENYEGHLRIHPEMAYFIPLIAAMGGNVGVQSSAIIVQSLANKSFRSDAVFMRLLRELSASLLNALVCSAVILSYNIAFSDSITLSLTVSLALFSVIVFASSLGTAVPLLLDRFRIDPALATGPFITTMNDIFGLFIYFLTGRLVYTLF